MHIIQALIVLWCHLPALCLFSGGVIGLTMVPLLADALGGEAAFLLSGALGITWAVCGALIMRQLQKTAIRSTTASSRQEKQQQREKLNWRLDAGSWRQVALLCYAHGVIGLGFFFMQVCSATPHVLPLLCSALFFTQAWWCNTWHLLVWLFDLACMWPFGIACLGKHR